MSEAAKPGRNMLDNWSGPISKAYTELSWQLCPKAFSKWLSWVSYSRSRPCSQLVAWDGDRSCNRPRSVTGSCRLPTAPKNLSPHLDRPQWRIKATTQLHLVFGPLLRELVIFFLDQCEFYTVRTSLRPSFIQVTGTDSWRQLQNALQYQYQCYPRASPLLHKQVKGIDYSLLFGTCEMTSRVLWPVWGHQESDQPVGVSPVWL